MSLALYAFLGWRLPQTTVPVVGEAAQLSIDVFVCTYDEPISVLEPTLVVCRAITVPHRTYLLDDGRRQEVRELAGRLGGSTSCGLTICTPRRATSITRWSHSR